MPGSEPKQRRRIAVILPGIGYTCDKPLLYYSAKLAASLNWEVLPVPYGDFPPKVLGDREKLRQSMDIALAQTEERLSGMEWTDWDEVLFISKSIGTAAAAAYADTHRIPCRHVLFTPVEETFDHPLSDAVAFHGTADPWADTQRIRRLCEKAGIPLMITEGANHSLETADVLRNIRILETVMRQVGSCLAREGAAPG